MRVKNPDMPKKILKYVIKYQQEHNGRSPSKSMIAEAVHSTKATVYHYLLDMVETGEIEYDGYDIKTMYSIPADAESNPAQILDNIITCGPGEDQTESISSVCYLPEQLFDKGEYFILTSRRDSMEDVGIFDGDMVIVEKFTGTPRKGQIIAALDNNNMTTLKLYDEIDGKPVLRYQNKEMYGDKIYECDVFSCQGILKYCIHKYN